MRVSSVLCLGVLLALTGCVTTAPAKYSWGNYENSLYSYYKDSTKSGDYEAELVSVISDSEATAKPVAPGLYAEYGFLLLQEGKSKDAITQFEKEKAKWPESTYLMNNLIRIASNPVKKTTASKE
ncbi:MAG: DUF4810 domain-containing protein [Herminiimonas sp.]|jgi:hypothetical protein|uniref:DUF4810 domain-containing protein n=1 Tax=Herminiimonas sp. TaxID=1926289 RepID=UPI002720E968|nr:DUF4810 domain-containing protein [Herminiimonas sp.]MDO9422331.1 DUF4810 domain-containing protein [Herminiimonas sp.]